MNLLENQAQPTQVIVTRSLAESHLSNKAPGLQIPGKVTHMSLWRSELRRYSDGGENNTITSVYTRKKKEVCLFLLCFPSTSGKGYQGPCSLQDIANKRIKRLGTKNLVAAANGSLHLLSTYYVPSNVLSA